MKIVTSFSPNRIERQQYCVSTWAKYGLPIVAVQTTGEAAQMQQYYPSVTFVETDKTGIVHHRPRCPTIAAICEQASDDTILLVNSDISIKDTSEQFKHQWVRDRGKTLVVGIRKDFAVVGGAKWLNPYGIDAYRVTPAMAELVIADESRFGMGFAIGCAGWDYWITWLLWQQGYNVAVANSSLLHPIHSRSYSQDDVDRAADMFLRHYRLTPHVMTTFIQEVTRRQGAKWLDKRQYMGISAILSPPSAIKE